jgi:hypothetical protein
MREQWLPVVGRIEWRSERHARTLPRAVVLGGESLDVEVLEAWIEGPAVAGDPVVHVFMVLTADGRRLRLHADSRGSEQIEAPVGELAP